MRGDPRAVFGLDLEPAGPLRRLAFRMVRPHLDRLLGLAWMADGYAARPRDCRGADFATWSLDLLHVEVRLDESDLGRIPESGPVVVVANHPFGGVEGLTLGHLLCSRRADVKILANYYLGRIPELRDLFLLVDPFGTPEAARANAGTLRKALGWLEKGGVLAVFPAGEVAHLNLRRRRIEDPPWLPTAASLVRRARCPVVPVFFPGRNSGLFHVLGLIHPRLRTALLGREMLRRRGQPIEVRVGSPIPYKQLGGLAGTDELTAYLRSRTYILSQRLPVSAGAVQPRVTPRKTRPVAARAPAGVLAEEVERLPAESLLVDTGSEAVYVAAAGEIPNMLREIGRQREISFREVGEGTGRDVDLDVFDRTYLHLFVWSRENQELIGAYRLGLTDKLLTGVGLDGLYTSSLFTFKPRLFESMGPALEMGRSFIRSEYQKSYASLLLLWKGIGRFVLRDPRYATLFGPVSISADYQSASQRLIVAFLEQNKYVHEWSRWVRPRTPTRPGRASGYGLSPAQLRNLDDVSSFIAEIEADHKGVPILLRQYLRLGGRLLGFNVDPAFSNVLDVLIMVDLRHTDPKILGRYMGREGVARFRASHRPGSDSHSRAS
jgi:putative hemolysin